MFLSSGIKIYSVFGLRYLFLHYAFMIGLQMRSFDGTLLSEATMTAVSVQSRHPQGPGQPYGVMMPPSGSSSVCSSQHTVTTQRAASAGSNKHSSGASNQGNLSNQGSGSHGNRSSQQSSAGSSGHSTRQPTHATKPTVLCSVFVANIGKGTQVNIQINISDWCYSAVRRCGILLLKI